MDVRFSYEDNGDSIFGRIYRPIAKVTVLSPHIPQAVAIWMIVDTGADYTILPRFFAGKLRISLEQECITDVTLGVGGSQTIHFMKSKIQVKIGSLERQIPLAFFDNNEVPALLGRLGFFETFDVEFLKSHEVVFKG